MRLFARQLQMRDSRPHKPHSFGPRQTCGVFQPTRNGSCLKRHTQRTQSTCHYWIRIDPGRLRTAHKWLEQRQRHTVRVSAQIKLSRGQRFIRKNTEALSAEHRGLPRRSDECVKGLYWAAETELNFNTSQTATSRTAPRTWCSNFWHQQQRTLSSEVSHSKPFSYKNSHKNLAPDKHWGCVVESGAHAKSGDLMGAQWLLHGRQLTRIEDPCKRIRI